MNTKSLKDYPDFRRQAKRTSRKWAQHVAYFDRGGQSSPANRLVTAIKHSTDFLTYDRPGIELLYLNKLNSEGKLK